MTRDQPGFAAPILLLETRTVRSRHSAPTDVIRTSGATFGAWVRIFERRLERPRVVASRRARLAPLSKQLTLCEKPEGACFQSLRQQLKGACVYLVGMMGSGKSTVGAYLASALGYAFIDTDVVIERTLQKSISEVFAQEGEAYFRQVETLVMDSLQSHLRKVIATGGGVVLGQRNWGTLQTGLVVYLRATPELLVQRVEHGVGRPLLSTTSGPAADAAPISVRQEALQERLERILSEREHLYRQADVIMELDADMSVAQVAKAIALLLSQFIDEHPSVSSKFGTQQTAEP